MIDFFKLFMLPLLFMALAAFTYAQSDAGKISGKVTDETGSGLIGVNILITETGGGTTTDLEGNFSLSLDAGNYILRFSYIGYSDQDANVTVRAGADVELNITMVEGVLVDEIVVIGTRAANRTNTDAPVPIDVIDVDRLTEAAPQSSINSILHYAAPSFSSNTQTISDGTDHIDPASLRGLGPDQVLVLVNGKRRHTSSLVNVNGTFGRGNVGTDLNAIPSAALGNIEVLRDGAAAQYGSDAIAGVINLRLKNTVNQLDFNISTGAHFTKNASPQKDIDGETYEISANYGIPLGNNGGFVNMTGAFNFRGWTNRMQSFSAQIFNGYNAVEWVAAQDGADLSALTMSDVQDYAQQVSHFDQTLRDEILAASTMDQLQDLLNFDATDAELAARGQTRSDYNMRVGQSQVRGGKFFANMVIPMSDNMEFYSFGGMSYRDGLSGCFYRLPHQNRTYTPAYINGFVPKINSNITDQSATMGVRGEVKGWNIDLSNVIGSNKFKFNMTETHNATMQNASPLTFDAGGHSFTQSTGNADMSKYFDDLGAIKGINVAFGAEYRYENFKVLPGSEFSYGNYDVNLNLVNSITSSDILVTDFFGRNRPSGSQCFAGFLPSNDTDARRSSVGGYGDVEFDISEEFLIGTAIRYENYSDFGSTFNYKIATRYKITPNITARAAHSTGFRAPSLHQIHFSRTSTIFVTENNVTTAQEVGVFSNNSRAASLLGIPQLKEETSQSFSLGLTIKVPDKGLRITLDGYLVNIDDRIVLTGQFAPGTNPELISIFNQAQATRAAFFANAIDTQSKGIDLVISHKMLFGESTSLSNEFAATFSETMRVGDINASPVLEAAGLVDTYFDGTSRIYLEEAVPRIKFTLNNTLNIKPVTIYLRNTYFGPTTEASNDCDGINDPTGIDCAYAGKVITDLSVGATFLENLRITIGANNLLDIYPDEADMSFQSSGRFIYSRRSPQFSFGGRYLFARIAFTLK